MEAEDGDGEAEEKIFNVPQDEGYNMFFANIILDASAHNDSPAVDLKRRPFR